jgi:hypothetical protein
MVPIPRKKAGTRYGRPLLLQEAKSDVPLWKLTPPREPATESCHNFHSANWETQQRFVSIITKLFAFQCLV